LLDSSPGEKFFIYILHLFSKKIIEKSGNFWNLFLKYQLLSSKCLRNILLYYFIGFIY
jgi:hypothetical protein